MATHGLFLAMTFASFIQLYSMDPIVDEPMFISPGIISKIFDPLAFHKHSPFYFNEQQIYKMVELFIKINQPEKAFQMLRLVVQSERKWRMEFCIRVFGFMSCNGNVGNAAPFFIWKTKFTHKLLLNPTKEIIAMVERNVSSKLLSCPV